MVRKVFRAVLAALAAQALAVTFTVHAQSYPNKPITIVVPYAAGGAVDIVARSVGQPLSAALKQPVIIDNKPGASTSTR